MNFTQGEYHTSLDDKLLMEHTENFSEDDRDRLIELETGGRAYFNISKSNT